nr:hypothetical protein RF2 [Sarcophyte sanguinea]
MGKYKINKYKTDLKDFILELREVFREIKNYKFILDSYIFFNSIKFFFLLILNQENLISKRNFLLFFLLLIFFSHKKNINNKKNNIEQKIIYLIKPTEIINNKTTEIIYKNKYLPYFKNLNKLNKNKRNTEISFISFRLKILKTNTKKLFKVIIYLHNTILIPVPYTSYFISNFINYKEITNKINALILLIIEPNIFSYKIKEYKIKEYKIKEYLLNFQIKEYLLKCIFIIYNYITKLKNFLLNIFLIYQYLYLIKKFNIKNFLINFNIKNFLIKINNNKNNNKKKKLLYNNNCINSIKILENNNKMLTLNNTFNLVYNNNLYNNVYNNNLYNNVYNNNLYNNKKNLYLIYKQFLSLNILLSYKKFNYDKLFNLNYLFYNFKKETISLIESEFYNTNFINDINIISKIYNNNFNKFFSFSRPINSLSKKKKILNYYLFKNILSFNLKEKNNFKLKLKEEKNFNLKKIDILSTHSKVLYKYKNFYFYKKYIDNNLGIYKQYNPFSIFYKYNFLKIYTLWLFTLIGYKYINLILLYIFSDLKNILINLKKNKYFFVIYNYIFYILSQLYVLWEVIEKNFFFYKKNKWIYNLFLNNKEDIIYKNNKLLYIKSLNLFYFYLIIYFFFIYFIFINIFFIFKIFIELHFELKRVKNILISSYSIELQKFISLYPIIPPYKFNLYEYEITITYRIKLIYFYLMNKINNIFISITNIPIFINNIPIFINNFLIYIEFIKNNIILYKNKVYFSSKSKEIYSLIKKNKNIKNDFINNKIEDYIIQEHISNENEKELIIQFYTLKTKKKIKFFFNDFFSILSKNFINSNHNITKHSGIYYLQYLFNIYNKSIINYDFTIYFSLEKYIYCAYYQTLFYSQKIAYKNKTKIFKQIPFSLTVSLKNKKNILLIGYFDKYYLIKYLRIDFSIPFITIFLNILLFPKFKYYEILIFDYINHLKVRKNYNQNNDYNTELELLTKINTLTNNFLYKNKFYITFQFELVNIISPCIVWIPNIHYLNMNEFNLDMDGFNSDINKPNFTLTNLLVDWLIQNYNEKKNIIITATNVPKKINPYLIAQNRLNTIIKVRQLFMLQQKQHFIILSYTKGFVVEKKTFYSTNFKYINIGPNIRDLMTLINETLIINITKKKLIINIEIIRSALYKQTWDSRSYIKLIQNPIDILYQIGKIFTQNILLNNYPIDSITLYKKTYNKTYENDSFENDSFIYKWYFKFGINIKKLTIFIYFLICFSGFIVQDIWSLFKSEKNLYLHKLINENYDLIYVFLKILSIKKNDNKKLYNYFDIISFDKSFYDSNYNYDYNYDQKNITNKLYQKYEFEKEKQYFFIMNKFLHNFTDPFFFISKSYFMLLNYEFFSYELKIKKNKIEKNISASIAKNSSIAKKLFINKHLDFFIDHKFKSNKFLNKNDYFHNTNILFENYQYLLKLLLYNNCLDINEIIKTLIKNKWLFFTDF